MRFFDSACEAYEHSDPDEYGLCDNCGAILLPSKGDLEDARKLGVPVSEEVARYVEELERERNYQHAIRSEYEVEDDEYY